MATAEASTRRFLENPVIRGCGEAVADGERTATVAGAAQKSLVLLAILGAAFFFTWGQVAQSPRGEASGLALLLAVGGLFGGFVLSLVVTFFERTAPVLSPVYAACEGLFLGAISGLIDTRYPGAALTAGASVVVMTLGMLVLYASGSVRPTQKLAVGLLIALLGILTVSLTAAVVRACGVPLPGLGSFGVWAVVIQGAVVLVAALCLIVDFGLITAAAEQKAPRWFEWYAAFSLMVTLVWLYVELLRLAVYLASIFSD